MRTPICDTLGIEYPIFAFSYTREVVAEATKAGGFGVFGAIQYTGEQLEEHLTWLDKEVDGKPYGVDIVMPASYVGAGEMDPEALFEMLQEQLPEEHRRFVESLLEKHGVPPLPQDIQMRSLLSWTDATTRPQVDIALKHPIKLLANALGAPPADVIAKAHDAGVLVAALAGSARHAQKHVEAGVDVIVAQGHEAGGHTGEVAAMVLVPEVVDMVAPAPVLAAGGIGSGRQVAAALALGAQGAWTGSVWLMTTESTLPKIVKDKLARATSRDTVRSRALTGKPARQLKTAWTEAWDDPANPKPLPMPLQFMLTTDAIYRIYHYENPDLIGSPVGQIVGALNDVRPAREVVEELVRGFGETVERLRDIAGS
jgi:NAD(P)H-dependent flavin oxidoreductase YrpB (nitropropane dioxygenase family)